MQRKTAGFFLLGNALLFMVLVSDARADAFQADQVRHSIDRASREPAFANQSTTVIIESDQGGAVMPHVSSAGGTLRFSVGRFHEIDIPNGKLSQLVKRLPPSSVVRYSHPYQAYAVTSQGVALTGGSDMHALGNNGAGIKVGVIDLGFSNLSSAQASGDLPSSLVYTDYTPPGSSTTDHGTNVAQIVYDMAPGSQMYLAKISTDVQLYQAINDMVAAGVQVINHSVGWYGAAFYDGTGPVCDAVNSAVDNNAQWVNSMGNDRFRHYMGMFADGNNDRRHDFAAGQDYNTVLLYAGVPVKFILNWDAYPTTTINYDLLLYNGNPNSGGTQVASSTNVQGTLYPYPYEYISYTPSVNGTYYLVVKKSKSNTAHVRIALFSFGVDLGVMTLASSLAQPADCAKVISVAATYPGSDTPEYYSSEGPTTDGRLKPEVAAPDRVQTSLTGNFSGTSAASPHVAGGAALLRAQNPSLTPSQISWLLTSTAKDVYTTGFDSRTGNGRMSLDADGDGYNHDTDNCPLADNSSQANADGDGLGDACDPDGDNDGLTNVFENTIGTNPLLADTDADGLSDYFEVCYDGNCAAYMPGSDLNPLSGDTDGDGIPDNSDPNPLSPSQNGDLAPWGSPDGVVDGADYMVALRIVMGQITPTALELSHGDLYPDGAPDGVIDLSDLMLILKKVRE